MRPIAVVLFMIAVSAPTLAADEPQPQQEQGPRKEKRICRDTTPTGSRLSARICRSKSEWAAIDKANQERADREVDRVQTISRSDGTGFSAN